MAEAPLYRRWTSTTPRASQPSEVTPQMDRPIPADNGRRVRLVLPSVPFPEVPHARTSRREMGNFPIPSVLTISMGVVGAWCRSVKG
jgi:hypothetical protein